MISLDCSRPTPPHCDLRAAADRSWVDLSMYSNLEFDPGRGVLVRFVWYFVSLLVFESGWVPTSRPKRWLLRLFGARIGQGLVIKPHVRIKYPWRLQTGDHCWIGQEAWIDNLAEVCLGSHVCLSQRAYVCTGGHDYQKSTFDLTTKPVSIENGAWVGAASLVMGGVRIGANSLVAAGSIVTGDVQPATIVAGIPARTIGRRRPPADAQQSATSSVHNDRAA